MTTTDLPKTIRAFGTELSLVPTLAGQMYLGFKRPWTVKVWEKGTGRWFAMAACGALASLETNISAASPAAAVRSLRGIIANQLVSMEKLLGRKI